MQVGVSRQTLYTWQKEGCPLAKGADAVRDWRAKNKAAETSSIKQQQEMARLRKWEADARAQELDNMKEEGELVSRADVVSEFAEVLLYAKAGLEALADEIAKETPQKLRVKLRKVAKHATDRFLLKLSTWEPPGGSDDS